MTPRLRLVPMVGPVDQPYRPGRRVFPKRTAGIWSWRPDRWTEYLRAWAWKHKVLADLAIIAIVSTGIFCALYWLLDLRRAVKP